jgi:hypothetical protein
LNTSLTCASWLADSGSGFLEGMGNSSVPELLAEEPPFGDGGLEAAIAAID